MKHIKRGFGCRICAMHRHDLPLGRFAAKLLNHNEPNHAFKLAPQWEFPLQQ